MDSPRGLNDPGEPGRVPGARRVAAASGTVEGTAALAAAGWRAAGVPVNKNGQVSRSRTTDRAKAHAGVMTAAELSVHTVARHLDHPRRPARLRGPLPDDDWTVVPAAPGAMMELSARCGGPGGHGPDVAFCLAGRRRETSGAARARTTGLPGPARTGCRNRLPEPPAGRASTEKRLTSSPARIRLSI